LQLQGGGSGFIGSLLIDKHLKQGDQVRLLLVFFVIYTTVWLLGNDNLGTAIRLRILSYLVIFACMFIAYQEKVKLTCFNE
jgi:hypothetical protein